jgi:hypothetical protein
LIIDARVAVATAAALSALRRCRRRRTARQDRRLDLRHRAEHRPSSPRARKASCTFSQDGGSEERYTGHIRKLGLDLGITAGSVIVWGVFSPQAYAEGSLAGVYVGGSPRLLLSSASAPMCWSADRGTIRPAAAQRPAQSGLNPPSVTKFELIRR